MMKISVVTASYNQGSFLEECLWSVRNQNYPCFEHIVVDGASTDRTVDLLRAYSAKPGWQHLCWISEPDKGQSDALNKGFRLATGDIVGWLNSDDRYRYGCFQAVTAAFRSPSDADIIYGDSTWMNEKGDIWRVRREIDFHYLILLYHRVLFIPTTSTFFRRRILEDANFLDLSFQYAMDYEFFIRLAQKGYRFRHIPAILADFRWHPQSKSSLFVARQLEEHDRITETYSPFLRKIPKGFPRKLALQSLRLFAGGCRYMEKLRRGYYFTEYFPSLLIEEWGKTHSRSRE